MTGPKLRKYQQECKTAFRAGYSGGARNLGASLPTGTGKGNDLEAEVNTPDGLRLWGDLLVGDAVFGSNGLPTEVTGVFDRGTLPMYRVTMKHGESLLCDADHLWRVKRHGRMPRVVSTEWLLTQPLKDQDGYCWSVPVTKPIVRRYAFLPLDPYVVGSLIANGALTSTGTVLITPDSQVVHRVRKHTAVTALAVTETRTCPNFSLPGLHKVTELLNMRVHSRYKRIPRMYLEASIEQRVALLQGLMIADGSVRQGGRRSLIYSTTSPGLADDMRELVTSLGGTCGVSKYDRSRDDKPIEFSLHILLPLDLSAFDTDRKVARSQPNRAFLPRSAIISIEPAGNHECRCISVAAADQLYSVTRNHIVTHNTVIFASMAADAVAKGNQVDVVVHRDTLVQQAYDKLCAVLPEGQIGIVKADRNDVTAPVRVVSIHTVRNPERLRQLVRPRLAIIDEAHVSVSQGYMDYYDHIGALPGAASYDGQTFLAGFTATWMRNDNRGLGDVWQDVCFKRSMKWAVRNGFLVEPRAMQLGGNLDLSGVRTVSNPTSENFGDYNTSDLQDVVMVEDLLETVVQGYLKFAAGRPAVLFAPTQKSARYFLDGLLAAGVPVAEIFAGTGKNARRWAFGAFDAGQTHVLGTCTALAEGWDCPRCSVALMIRPTKSLLMFIQQVGRILRPWPGKTHGLILDFVGVTDDKDMRSIERMSVTPEAREVENPCPACAKERCLDCALCDTAKCHMRACVCDYKDDFERVPIPHTAKKIDGVQMVDLFAGTNARFLQTRQGIPFVQTKKHTYWVSMKDNAWAVGRCGAKSRTSGTWIAEGLESAEALELASDYALNEDPTIADKRSSWRNGSGKASPEQLDLIRRNRLNIPGAENMSKADLSDEISIAIASGLLAGIGNRS